jgi:signal transduction histidine kinase
MEIHERRRRLEELEARAERAERDREERARRAVAEERARIARELHDVVAHQMTVITLQADGARRVARDGDPRVIGALDTITATGKSALTEMRRMVGLLRTPEVENGHQDDSARLAPMPGLRDLDDLLEQVEAAGMPVDVEVRGDHRRLDDGAELSAYRVVQEALTNAMRHGGPGVTARVTVSYGDDGLALVVDDSGRGAVTWSGDGRAAGSSSLEPSNNGGHGLVGLRERIAVHGGEFEAGPRPGGGFRIRATIPYEPTLSSEL